jgi:hypothetical protein
MADVFINCSRCEKITQKFSPLPEALFTDVSSTLSRKCRYCDKVFCLECNTCERNDYGCEKRISHSEKRYDKLYDRLIRYATEIYRLREKYKDTDYFFFDGNTSSDSDSSDDNDESNHQ